MWILLLLTYVFSSLSSVLRGYWLRLWTADADSQPASALAQSSLVMQTLTVPSAMSPFAHGSADDSLWYYLGVYLGIGKA